MPALKLFVSHSSRLDDVEHQYTRDDRNWCLLEDTCRAIRQKYGDRVEVLVDKDGLIPGDDWNHQLNLWLAECHVAIILFSRRAIDKSDWVAKEAAILSWRAELDERFTLIPVMLDGESTPEDLVKDCFGKLQINKSQCIQNAQTADDVVAGIVQKLGGPEDLAGTYSQTPLERLQGGIAKLLSDATTSDSLKQALNSVGCTVLPNGRSNYERYADLLARQLLSAEPEDAHACFRTFQKGIDPLVPRPELGRAEELFRAVRSLWVQPRAAGQLPLALQHKYPLAMVGQFLTLADDVLKTQAYTLERYLERAWPGSSLYCCVTVTSAAGLDEVKAEIRRRFFGAGLPPMIEGATLDKNINQDAKTIILVVAAHSDGGGLPDPRVMRDLERLENDYDKLVLIFALETTNPTLPDQLRGVEPPLDSGLERDAYLAERAAKTYLDQKYGIGQ